MKIQGGKYLSRGPVPEDRITIGKRKWKQYALKAAPYRSALAGPLVCPECGGAVVLEGKLWPCDRCAGVFVENAPFAEMVHEISGSEYALPPTTNQAGPRECPACQAMMSVELFHGSMIDRCAAHGIWFDDQELAAVLVNAGSDHEPHGVGGWLRRLFFT